MRIRTAGLATLALLLSAAADAGTPTGQPPQPSAQEPALAIAADDPALAWGACPAFMPPGCALAVLHGDPAQPNADVFLRVPGKSEIASHWHSSAERMVLVAGAMEVRYDGQPPVTLGAGSYAYGPAKRPHSATCTSADPCLLFIAFEGPVDAVPMSGGEAP